MEINEILSLIAVKSLAESNRMMEEICGIVDFFYSEEDKNEFIREGLSVDSRSFNDKVAYGDWQTPGPLSEEICKRHLEKYGSPDIVVEPTCGMGSFVLAALSVFPDVAEIHAVEINKNYTNILKRKIFDYALRNNRIGFPKVYIYTEDFFKFDAEQIFSKARISEKNIAVVGNPPWVTNSRQGRSGADNLPVKNNRYNLKGIDAITGKSNFDISESITLKILDLAGNNTGGISLLLKNSVIRNVICKQREYPFQISDIEQYVINADKEFGVSVSASCLSARFGEKVSLTCDVKDFYKKSLLTRYGWMGDSFVSDCNLYKSVVRFDGKSAFIWRSGIKHDCSPILELTIKDGVYYNGLGEIVDIEDDLIYPLLKSSDVHKLNGLDNRHDRYLILPQHSVGENTASLQYMYPLAYDYLSKHLEYFVKRRSSIYKGKDPFSIFGIGDYSFKPYKVVVSSLYKDIQFRLVTPCNGKSVMVDDTCYQYGCDSYEEALAVAQALNGEEIQTLIRALTFNDAKRVVTKSLLMRLDLDEYFRYKGKSLRRGSKKSITYVQPSLFD